MSGSLPLLLVAAGILLSIVVLLTSDIRPTTKGAAEEPDAASGSATDQHQLPGAVQPPDSDTAAEDEVEVSKKT